VDTKFFYGQNEEGLTSRTALVRAFGEELGLGLYGVAVKLSRRLGLDEGDAAQEAAEAAINILRENKGEVVLSHVANRVKDAVCRTYNYGVNEYYGKQGVSELYTDAAEDGDGWMDTLATEYSSLVAEDLSEAFSTVYETLSKEQVFILHSLAQGWNGKEIAEACGKTPAWVSYQKTKLQGLFGYAIA